MRISVFGLGYVGAVSVACLARDGHSVVGVDIDESKLELIAGGNAPIVEAGIQELMAAVVAEGRVTVTSDASEAIRNTDIALVCVGTPSQANGAQDQTAIRRLSQQLGAGLKDCDHYPVVVIRSTVEPGTTLGLVQTELEAASGKKVGEDFGLCFQPEFLREGTSIEDYDNPPFTIVGGDSDKSIERVHELFSHLPCEFIGTDIGTAELMKYACNCFHAVKITFANEIARLCQAVNVDGRKVMDLVCQDRQLNISPAYMKPGFAFGGSCLPKDLRALAYVAKTHDLTIPMLANVLPSNRVHIDHAVDYVLSAKKRSVLMVGLSFKSGTDDLRESPLVVLAERFIGKGLDVKIFDPEVSLSRLIGANKRYIEEVIPHLERLLITDLTEAIKDADVLVLGLGDKDVVDQTIEHCSNEQFLLDLTGKVDPEDVAASYQGVCW